MRPHPTASAAWLLALYAAVGWHSDAAVFRPLASLRTVSDGRVDASTAFREIENHNLARTAERHPVLGLGFGHPYEEVTRGPRPFELFRYYPHNSVLWLVAVGGLLGFPWLLVPYVVGCYLAARGYRNATRPTDRAAARFSVRARDRAYQRRLIEMVRQAADAGGLATDATLEFTETRGYSNMVANEVVADVFAKHLSATERVVDEPRPNQRMGSTDMGDISQIMPAVHAYLSIAPRNVPNHTLGFTEAAASPAGDKAVIDGALAMAQTAADLFADPSLVAAAKAEFQAKVEQGILAGYDAWLESGKLYAPAPRPA